MRSPTIPVLTIFLREAIPKYTMVSREFSRYLITIPSHYCFLLSDPKRCMEMRSSPHRFVIYVAALNRHLLIPF